MKKCFNSVGSKTIKIGYEFSDRDSKQKPKLEYELIKIKSNADKTIPTKHSNECLNLNKTENNSRIGNASVSMNFFNLKIIIFCCFTSTFSYTVMRQKVLRWRNILID